MAEDFLIPSMFFNGKYAEMRKCCWDQWKGEVEKARVKWNEKHNLK
jgi:hypothetical protein